MPVFANVQRAIESEAETIDRALGDRMEKSGEKAGERAGKAASKKMAEELKKGSGQFERDFQTSVDGINKALGGIQTNKLGNAMRREVADIKKELAGLKDLDLTAEADFKRAYAEIAVLEGRLRGLRDDVKIVFRSDIDQALKGMAKLAAAKESIEDPVEIEVSADFKVAERQMSAFEKSFKKTAQRAAGHLSGAVTKEGRKLRDELKYLENLRIGIDISSDQARREINEIARDLDRMQSESTDIDIKVESAAAFAELAALEAALEKIEADEIDIQVDVDTAKARAGLFGLRRSGDDAANSFRSFNIILLAAVGAGPALVPVLAAIAGGLLAIGPAAAVAGAGLGSVLVGFSGLGDVLTALQAQQDQAATTAVNAAKQESNSARAVADARRSAARAIESALDQQAAAQERYRDSINDVKEAEEALREARAAAQGTGADLKRDIRGNELALDQALLDSFNATVTYQSVMADGSSTNAEQEQARIDREEALLRLRELRAEQRELAKEKKKWDKEGVNGTDEVQSAQEALLDAIDAQREAYQDLGQAAQDVDRARADGARAVRDAMRGQAEAMADVDTQAQNVETALSKLGPAGRAFALYLFSLREGFREFRDDVQTVMLPAIQEAMEGFLGSRSASIARDALIGLANAFGQFAIALSQSLQGDAWTDFFRMLAEYGPGIMAAYGGAFIAFMEGMASLLTVLAPYAQAFADGFRRMMESFAGWASSKEGAEGIQRFMGYVEQVAGPVLEFVGALAGALTNLFVALAPYAGVILGLLTGLLDYIAAMDPAVLGVIVSTLIVLITASQVAYAVMNLFMAGAALFASTVGLIVFALVGIGLAIAYLWTSNEDFRNAIKDIWGELKDFFVDAWERISSVLVDGWNDHIKPALKELGDAFMQLWERILEPLFRWLGPILVDLAEWLIPILSWAVGVMVKAIARWFTNILIPSIEKVAKFFKWLWQDVIVPAWEGIKWAWNNILKPAWDAIVVAAKWLWEKVKDPIQTMKDAWGEVMAEMEWAWENILKPVWDFIRNKALPALERAFDNTVEGIKSIWEGLKKIIGAPIKFVIETILNDGLIAGFNKVANFVGSDGINPISVPEWTYAQGGVFGRGRNNAYAGGGIMPGYTPGQDVHHFVSPTGGRLNLSGGEAIMRPEWTAAMGPSYVDQMNAIARAEGVTGIRRAMGQAFAKGGIFWPTDFRSLSADYPGHTGVDISIPGTGDYGHPVFAAHSGVATYRDYGGESYGQSVWIAGKDGFTTIYAHLAKALVGMTGLGTPVTGGQKIGEIGSTGNSSGPHLHFEVRPGGTRAAALDYLYRGKIPNADERKGGARFPDWIVDIARNPIGYFKDMVTDPIDGLKARFGESDMLAHVMGAPAKIVGAMGQKIWGMMPEALQDFVGGAKKVGIKAASEGAGIAIDVFNTLSSVGGWFNGNPEADQGGPTGDFWKGGILPYNGTMKYDAGGYLPPGLTSVVNLTGKPEPVFTNDQWREMGGGAGGGNIHYEPHFEGSDLTAEDVAGDLQFAFRRIKREGKYARVGEK